MVQNYSHRFACLFTALLLLATLVAGGAAGQASSPVRVQGKVSDPGGSPLVGVTVVAAGQNSGVTTGITGEYSITCPADGVLEFSYLGYKKASVPVAGRTVITLSLEEDRQEIDQVIVIGYGTTTRRRATGAVDQIKADAIADRSTANLTQALQGTSPSLTIQQRSFDPNDQQLNINIRGIGTMNDNSPLIVIDGLVSDGASLNKRKQHLREYFSSPISAYEFAKGRFTHKEHRKFIQQVIEIINSNLTNKDLSAKFIADKMNMGIRQLYRKLQGLEAESPLEMIHECRLHVAEDLLKNSTFTTDEIIYKSGFANRGPFFKAFSARFGCTPKEYRERIAPGREGQR
ncbi:MAG: helix-turn-helix domain-containing protein [Rikenellaceae bacterium]|jgi:AraC-like DNA-binding protein|nr:helix-turn-helix domain-containing protein [Rikenellaceae bacterium]